MRSPSGLDPGTSRGVAPTATMMVLASMRSGSPPKVGSTITWWLPSRRPRPEITRTPSFFKVSSMSSDWLFANASRRLFTASRSISILGCTATSSMEKVTPRLWAWATRWAASAVATRVLDGTTSVSTALPPMPLSSMRITSAPSCRPARAAS